MITCSPCANIIILAMLSGVTFNWLVQVVVRDLAENRVECWAGERGRAGQLQPTAALLTLALHRSGFLSTN